jgi:hypothetical protein
MYVGRVIQTKLLLYYFLTYCLKAHCGALRILIDYITFVVGFLWLPASEPFEYRLYKIVYFHVDF